ncbi:hypothetical protein QR680_010858 [Steinernema hermaphroditum]|uniref:SHSP domain-containing protein n=1 Tax=Steinernema hermaphroditum TaxID=289476 RepID=A0AA39MCI1_9BILA|nr:hypothetical protein QR680_010858 [Steinernema hermaphroditum]
MESEIANLRELVEVALKTITEQYNQITHYKTLLAMKERSDSQKEDVPAEKHPEASVSKESEEEKNRRREDIRLRAILSASRSFEIGVFCSTIWFPYCFALLYYCCVLGRISIFRHSLLSTAMGLVEIFGLWFYVQNATCNGCRAKSALLSERIREFGDRKLGYDFSVSFKTSEFAPEELEVSVVGDSIVVEGKHSSESENGSIERHFCQKMLIPSDVDPESIQSALDSNGNLSVSAKIKKPAVEGGKRTIPIGVHDQK